MDLQDHAYTSTTYARVTPAEFSYKMNSKELEDFVRLRMSNKYLFSGRRNTTTLAWRAVLKHMGLQHKMSHIQAAKKWEYLKKKYKELKNPPEGSNVTPESWPHFALMDDAMQGRLEAKSSNLKACPSNKNAKLIPIISIPKRRKASTSLTDLLSGGSEIEVTLNGDGDAEASPEGRREMDRIMQEMEEERSAMDGERQVMEWEKQMMERERVALQRERAVLDRETAALDRDRASLERERAVIEREKALLERERAMVAKDKDAVSRDRQALEREKDLLARLYAPKERTAEATEDAAEDGGGGGVNESEVMDRKERFFHSFEKLIENF